MDTSSSITFEGLILRTAIEAGLHDVPDAADNRSKIPSDPAVLDRIKRAVNDGRQEFYRRLNRCTCMRQFITLQMYAGGDGPYNIEGDAATYQLPLSVQAIPLGLWHWRLDAASGPVAQRHAADIARLLAGDESLTGPPVCMAVANQLSGRGVATRISRSVLHVYPRPDAAYVLAGEVRFAYSPLVALDDTEPVGDEHALAMVEAAIYFMERANPDIRIREHHYARMLDAFKVSEDMDRDRRPRSLGLATDPNSVPMTNTIETDGVVTHVNGIPVQ
jgi:hypothetical protein